MTLRILLIWPPRNRSATIATIAIRARISAYSARPWPSSSRLNEAMRAERYDMWLDTPSPVEHSPDGPEAAAIVRAGRSGVKSADGPICEDGHRENARPPALGGPAVVVSVVPRRNPSDAPMALRI